MVLLYTTVISLAVAYIIYNRFFHPLANVPGPFLASLTKLWLSYQSTKRNRHQLDLKLHEKYGSIVRIAPNEIMFKNADYLHEVYGAGTAYSKGSWYDAAASETPWGLDLLVERDIEKYRLQRRLIGPVYSIPGIKKHEELIDNGINRFFVKMRSKAGEILDWQRWMELFTIDTLCEVTYGHPLGTLDAETDWGHMEQIGQFWSLISWLGFFPWLTFLEKLRTKIIAHPLFPTKKSSASTSPVFRFCIDQVEKRTKISCNPPQVLIKDSVSITNPRCILEDLFAIHHRRPEFKPGWAIGMSVTDLGAGNDTITWTMDTIVASIVQHVDVYSKVQDEIKSALLSGTLQSSGSISYDEACQLEYLQSCMREAMRLYPNIGFPLVRVVPKNKENGIIIDGHHIPPGTVVGINTWVHGRNSNIYGEDATEYKPQRWINATKEQRGLMNKCDLSFGSAARSCPGRHLGWVIMSKAVATLFRDYEVDICNKMNSGIPGPGGHYWKEEVLFTAKWSGMEVKLTTKEKEK